MSEVYNCLKGVGRGCHGRGMKQVHIEGSRP